MIRALAAVALLLSLGCCSCPPKDDRRRIKDFSEIPAHVIDHFSDWKRSRQSDSILDVRVKSGLPATHWKGDLRFVEKPQFVTVPCPEAVEEMRRRFPDEVAIAVENYFVPLYEIDGELFEDLEMFVFHMGETLTDGSEFYVRRLIASDGTHVRADLFGGGRVFLGR